MHIVLALIEGHQYGLPLSAVERCLLALEATPMPNAPEYVLGVFNIHGRIVPVMNTRLLLGLPSREVDPADQFILCRINETPIALWVDRVKEIRRCTENDLLPAADMLPHLETIRYVIKDDTQLILLIDLERLIPVAEQITRESTV